MSKNIYSDLWAETLITEMKDIKIYIYDRNGDRYKPNLILDNLLEVKKLRDYLNEVLEEHWNEKWEESHGPIYSIGKK